MEVMYRKASEMICANKCLFLGEKNEKEKDKRKRNLEFEERLSRSS
jgi:hypothetical protein